MAGPWKKMRGALKPENARSLIFSPENSMPLMAVLFVMEMFINVWVITNIRCKLGVLLNSTPKRWSLVEYSILH